ncbi:MAG: hypothetical protein EBS90_04895 [Betaproteobacteria bacterium]|nr:hypothetical protein [Betaproteobacteria bacterium]
MAAAVPTPSTPVAAASPPPSPEALKQELEQKGLQWVQTDPSKAAHIEPPPEPPPALGRAPRRQQVSTEAEPLVMVETRAGDKPAS